MWLQWGSTTTPTCSHRRRRNIEPCFRTNTSAAWGCPCVTCCGGGGCTRSVSIGGTSTNAHPSFQLPVHSRVIVSQLPNRMHPGGCPSPLAERPWLVTHARSMKTCLTAVLTTLQTSGRAMTQVDLPKRDRVWPLTWTL